ncbi:MAG: 6,7-dimethyl-8-ribityllumazine synthase [Lentisphaeria bacterium]|nr:6,7-dimethyl-8-ribityllumazine synthase [Lentisphaeria bacterium]
MSAQGKIYEGMLNAKGLRIGIVCARFNDFFVNELLGGALDTLRRLGGDPDDVDVAWVPGSFEIPLVISKMMDTGKYDATIALGMVIRGSTTHADHINSQVSKALGQLALEKGIPAVYGVVSTENIEQAIERSGTKAGNRGADAARTAVEMANLLKNFVRKG